MQSKFLPVPDAREGDRLDAGLAKMLGISRTATAEIIESGGVTLEGRPLGKSHRLSPGEVLEVVLLEKPARVSLEAEDVPVLLARGIELATSGAQERQGIVLRLDVGTSGLMVLAKGERAYSMLKQAFRDRTPKKTYHALVQGHPDPASGTIDTPIARSQKHDYKFTISQTGKPAVTHYQVKEMLPSAALVEVGLETGRTHQIRVHFSHFRHPLVGAPLYGSDPKLAAKLDLDRQWLHAMKLGFTHPISGEWVEFTSDYPSDLEIALGRLRDVGFRL
ncbi:MAG: RluA family pseudouridine synthase [Aquiluna sp.]